MNFVKPIVLAAFLAGLVSTTGTAFADTTGTVEAPEVTSAGTVEPEVTKEEAKAAKKAAKKAKRAARRAKAKELSKKCPKTAYSRISRCR